MALMAYRLRRAVALARPFSTISSSYSTGFLQKPVSSTMPLGYGSTMPLGYRPLRGMNVPSPFLRDLTVRFIRPEPESVRERVLQGMYPDHWLILMEWPDPQPSREEKIDTFIKTLTNVIGSEEEAKKAIYALSTTLYTGFMCIMPEELSEKIKNEPGVVKVLPSINKLYGIGDKYINGEIRPDPPSPNSRSGGSNSERIRNRRRNSVREAVGIDTMQSGSMQGDVQVSRPAVDGRGPIGGERQDNRPPSMDGGVRDYGLPPRDGRAQDYGTEMGGRGGDYGPPMDGRGPDYRAPMERRGTDYRTPMDGRGTPMDGRGPMPPGDQQYYRPPTMDGRGPVPAANQQGYGPHQDQMPSREPIQGQRRDTWGNQERDTPHEGQRESLPWPMEETN